tara:strand:+ start:3613 stop:3720 length:108 start_codon:yes stop_codon:yes gene_type:complete
MSFLEDKIKTTKERIKELELLIAAWQKLLDKKKDE